MDHDKFMIKFINESLKTTLCINASYDLLWGQG